MSIDRILGGLNYLSIELALMRVHLEQAEIRAPIERLCVALDKERQRRIAAISLAPKGAMRHV